MRTSPIFTIATDMTMATGADCTAALLMLVGLDIDDVVCSFEAGRAECTSPRPKCNCRRNALGYFSIFD